MLGAQSIAFTLQKSDPGKLRGHIKVVKEVQFLELLQMAIRMAG